MYVSLLFFLGFTRLTGSFLLQSLAWTVLSLREEAVFVLGQEMALHPDCVTAFPVPPATTTTNHACTFSLFVALFIPSTTISKLTGTDSCSSYKTLNHFSLQQKQVEVCFFLRRNHFVWVQRIILVLRRWIDTFQRALSEILFSNGSLLDGLKPPQSSSAPRVRRPGTVRALILLHWLS